MDMLNAIEGGLNKNACEVDRSPSFLEDLQRQQRRQREQLNNTEAAIKALNDNPKILEVLEFVLKAKR